MEITQVKSKTIINSSHILKPSYHMNYGKKRIETAIYNKFPFSTLEEVCTSVFTGGIFKRVFVDDSKFGDPYISAQHMMNTNPLDVAKIISKKYTPKQEEMSLKENQILVSCAGTIGNVRLISKDLEGIIGSQDIIRVNPNNSKIPYGYLYAYLASKTAYNYMQSYIYGSVVPRIEPKTLSKLPIPLLSQQKQLQIHQFIVEGAKFRQEANELMKTAQMKFDDLFEAKHCNIISFKQNSKNLKLFQHRLDASYNIYKQELDAIIRESGIPYKNLGEHINKIFIPNRGKRIYVKEGLQYLSTSDLSSFNPTGIDKYLSLKMTGVDTLRVKKNWVLIARSGQEILGSTYLIGEQLNNIGVNEHALRVLVNENIAPYIYAFLSSRFGRKYLRAGIFGSAILTINEDYVKTLLLPELDEENKELITDLVIKSSLLFDQAIIKENQAIELIEKEIDLWQVS